MISVIVPTHNRARLLFDRCIPSILAQTITDWECHVVGDGTHEETVIGMEELCRRDSRFRFTNLPHFAYPDNERLRWGTVGLAARNFGLDYAKGEWIAELDDDDEWLPEHHQILLQSARRTGADHIYGISESTNGQRRWGEWPPGDGKFANGSNMYKASLSFRYNVRSMVETDRTGDADLWLRMLAAGVVFNFVPHIVHRYHESGTRSHW